ncbi:DUF2933 domain-containing protein [Phototrophicus methaneseepsis]|uniref:DUF2933 domain-containing protein n=1 Tax=Phototrophicus methaneseepsis TaxID=2710758 RepID=A0A7S8IF14_9CHLR|nr:DUF2933 domain-containing protein [Phototrophicus methaneseepsis]
MNAIQKININKLLGSPTRMVFVTFLAISAFFLITEHTAHVFGLLPYALLLLCPFLHLFMHGKHGSHSHSSNTIDEKPKHRHEGDDYE